MFWRNWSWTVRIRVGLVISFIAFAGVAVNRAVFISEHSGFCPFNLKGIGLGFLQYVQDYDGKMPPAPSNIGWASAVYPYLQSERIFRCPTRELEGWKYSDDPRQTAYTDYFLNAQLQNRNLEKSGDVTRLIMVAEGNDGQDKTDGRYAKPAIPTKWRSDRTSPSFRHKGGANYLFADGHVKAFKAADISTNWSANKVYFQPKKSQE
ncbi:hypothetical protein EON80_11290 [bacterium]|nr:MAG: hypothetical protein EON80_11290 [bacterium]